MKCGLWKYHKSPFSLTFFSFFFIIPLSAIEIATYICVDHIHTKYYFPHRVKLKIWVVCEALNERKASREFIIILFTLAHMKMKMKWEIYVFMILCVWAVRWIFLKWDVP